MLNNLISNISKIYIVYGATDFRKQIYSLCALVENNFKVSAYDKVAFVFCNKKRTSIKVLCYDNNGFVLAQKVLLNENKMKFQWPKGQDELNKITKDQFSWLLSGLKIYPDKCFNNVDVLNKKVSV